MYRGKTEEWSDRLLQVTGALYRVTGLLPADEPLRIALREYANQVLAGCIVEMRGALRGSAEPESKIETLLGFLAVARALTEVKQENFLVLEREYRAFLAAWAGIVKTRASGTQKGEEGGLPIPLLYRSKIGTGMHPSRMRRDESLLGRASIPSVNNQAADNHAASERQQAILDRLAKTPQAKVSDFYEILHGVSPKTIQRDLHDLVARNAVKREGERRWTIYTLPVPI